MVERLYQGGRGGIPEDLWNRDIPHREKNLQILCTGVWEILSERDPSHRKLFEHVFDLIPYTPEAGGIKLLPFSAIGGTPVEFGFQLTKDASPDSLAFAGFHELQPVIYLDETQLFPGTQVAGGVAEGRHTASQNFFHVWEEEMRTQEPSSEVADGNIQDWQEETRLEAIGNDRQKAKEFVLARFQGQQLAQLVLPFAMAATYYATVVAEKPRGKFPPEGQDMRKISPEVLFQQEREPLFFDSFRRIYRYWGERLGFSGVQIEAAIPADTQHIADAGFADFLNAVKKGPDFSDNQTYLFAHGLLDRMEKGTATDKERNHHLTTLRTIYKKFIVLRALFSGDLPPTIDAQTVGEQLRDKWI